MTYRTSLEAAPTSRAPSRRLGRRERIVREIEAVKDVSFEVPRGLGGRRHGRQRRRQVDAHAHDGGHPAAHRGARRGARAGQHAARARRRLQRKLTGPPERDAGRARGGAVPREQLQEKYDEIVEFAELEDFMDMPMRTYSSGMYGRLGFSVAVNMEPDILLIDEALSVGDARFRKKSFHKMRELCSQDRTIVLVSHALRHDPGPVRRRRLDAQGRAADAGRAAGGDRRLHASSSTWARTRSRWRTCSPSGAPTVGVRGCAGAHPTADRPRSSCTRGRPPRPLRRSGGATPRPR